MRNSEEKKITVHEFGCNQCDAKYIGESSRSAGQRRGGHQKASPKKM